MQIATQRLLIREFEQHDLHRTFTPSSTAEGVPLQPFDLRRPEGIRRRVRAALESADEVPRVIWDLAVTTAGDALLIGRAGLQRDPESPDDAMVWFVTDPSVWNQGYASEGAKAVVDYCFGELNLHRIWAECDPTNEGAIRLLEGLGLRREAHFIENRLQGSTWHDSAVYAQLKREWKVRQG